MASVGEANYHKDPNFAVICNFLERFGELIGLKEMSYLDLERWFEETKHVPMQLIDLHVRLLRRIGKTSVTANKWENYIVKFCHSYSVDDALEIQQLGYKHCKMTTKMKLLKNLLEKQFDYNSTFKEKINKLSPEEMRFQPIGKDKNGLAYWYMLDAFLRRLREDESYVCGDMLPEDTGLVVRCSLLCVTEAEITYYGSTVRSFLPPCCIYCGSKENLLENSDDYISELLQHFSQVRPLCGPCRDKGLDAKTWGRKFVKPSKGKK